MKAWSKPRNNAIAYSILTLFALFPSKTLAGLVAWLVISESCLSLGSRHIITSRFQQPFQVDTLSLKISNIIMHMLLPCIGICRKCDLLGQSSNSSLEEEHRRMEEEEAAWGDDNDDDAPEAVRLNPFAMLKHKYEQVREGDPLKCTKQRGISALKANFVL